MQKSLNFRPHYPVFFGGLLLFSILVAACVWYPQTYFYGMPSLERSPKVWFSALFPPIVWAGIIFLFSSQSSLPGVTISTLDFLIKKFAHMTVYFVLYLLTLRATLLLQPKAQPQQKRVWLLAILLCFVYAASDEFHQSFIPNRTPTVSDLGLDMTGVLLAFLWRYRYI